MPLAAVPVGVLQVLVGHVVVADVRAALLIQGDGGVLAHVPGAVHRLDGPLAVGVPAGILQVAVDGVVVADVDGDGRGAGDGDGGVGADAGAGVHRLLDPSGTVVMGVVEAVAPVGDVRAGVAVQRQAAVGHVGEVLGRVHRPHRPDPFGSAHHGRGGSRGPGRTGRVARGDGTRAGIPLELGRSGQALMGQRPAASQPPRQRPHRDRREQERQDNSKQESFPPCYCVHCD